MLSIFATPAEAKAFAKQHGCGTPRRPLKPKTLARIAGGLDKFVLKAAKPFIVRCAHGDQSNGGARWGHSSHSADEPLPTVSGSKDFAAVDVSLAPFGVPRYGERDGQAPRSVPIDVPLPTITGTGNQAQLVGVTLSTLNHGGPEHRGADIDQPIATVTGANDARALVAALMTKHYGGVRGSAADAPLDTITACDHNALTVAYLNKHRGESIGTAADEPCPTITSGAGAKRDAGAAHALGMTCAYLSHFYTSNTRGGEGDLERPAKTLTSGGQHAAVTVALAMPYIVGTGGAAYAAKPKAVDVPANTVMVNDRRAVVAAFIQTYYGNGGSTSPAEPSPTVTGRDRLSLITVVIDGETYVVTDIAMRMLTPRELARCQGFPDDYVIDRTAAGKPVSKADQVKLVGNSVPPAFGRAIVKANVVDQDVLLDASTAGKAAS